ncbi:MAG: hypothetical protein AAGI37_09890 [Planctomycetota bacterium]
MPLLETPGQRQPTAEDGARRIRQTLFHTVTQMEQSLAQVRRVIERHGQSGIIGALGDDAAELTQVYKKIKKCITDIDKSREVEDLSA